MRENERTNSFVPTKSILPIKTLENLGRRCTSRITLTLQLKKKKGGDKEGKRLATGKRTTIKGEVRKEIMKFLVLL